MSREIRNAKISDVSITRKGALMVLSVTVNYGGESQGACQACLYSSRSGEANSEWLAFLYALMDVQDVKSVARLEGTVLRVDASYNKVYRLGHLLNDRWLSIPGAEEEEGKS